MGRCLLKFNNEEARVTSMDSGLTPLPLTLKSHSLIGRALINTLSVKNTC